MTAVVVTNKQEQNCTRRAAFVRAAHVFTSSVAVANILVTIGTTIDFLSSKSDQPKAVTEQEKQSSSSASKEVEYPYMDKTIKTQQAFVRNLGVEHSAASLKQNRALFISAIKDCDILLCEGAPIDFFFIRLSDYAKSKDKQVEFLETETLLDNSMRYVQAALLASTYGGIRNMKLASSEEKISVSRRSAIMGFTFLAGMSGLPSLPVKASDLAQNSDYLHYDPAPVTAGRSILMLAELYKVCHANPGKKILLVTGDIHAKYIQNLLEKGEDSLEYRAKLAAYNLLL